MPVVPPEQNGTGEQYQKQETLDTYGRRSETINPRGNITLIGYNNATGAVVRRVSDASPPPESGAEMALQALSDGQQNLVTDYECDNHGRVLREFGPVHEAQVRVDESTVEALMVRKVDYTVYRDDLRQVLKTTGYARGDGPDYTFVTVGSVRITCRDDAGRITDEIEATRVADTGPLSYAETFPRKRWNKWTRQIYDGWGQLLSLRVYHCLPESGDGERNINFNETCYGYDSMGRENRVVSPGGTISRTVFDARDLVTSRWVGTCDAGATDTDPAGGGTLGNNMVVVLENEYDGGQSGGDGLLTKETKPVDSDSENDRSVEHTYDFRGRRVDTLTSDGSHLFISRNLYDNLDRVTGVDTYHTAVAPENLTGRQRWYFDNQGRIYREEKYAVDPEDGSNWVALVGQKWYDSDGNLIKEIKPGSEAITLLTYDNLGREVMRYLAYAPPSTSSSSEPSSEEPGSSSSSSSSIPFSSEDMSSASQSSSSELQSESSSSSFRSSNSSEDPSSSSVEESVSYSSSSSSSGSDSSSSSSIESIPPFSSSLMFPSSSSMGSSSSEDDSSSSFHSWASESYSGTITPPCECPAEGDEETCPVSQGPVRYSNGQIVLEETDLSTWGFAGWAHSRSYGNLLAGESPAQNGNLWLVRQLSNLVFDAGENGDCIIATRGANSSLWFQPDGLGGWLPMFGFKNSLVHDEINHRYVLTTPEGQSFVYFDTSVEIPAMLQGRLQSFVDAGGLVIAMQYNELFQMVRMNQTDGSQNNDFVYSYLGDEAGPNAGQLERVTLEINGVPVRQVIYRYYSEGQAGGLSRDLQQVTIREYNTLSSAWQTLRRQAYRYYTTNAPGGCTHGLKYELGPESYARMVASGLDPLSSSDTEWAAYADKHFRYDASRRVVREDLRGGRRTYLFAYQTNPDDPGYEDYNSWYSKTTETNPDGTIITIFANRAGRSILNRIEAGAKQWCNYFHYNDEGRLDLRAWPSAVAGVVEPDEENPNLVVNLKSNQGLIKIKTYYGMTNPTNGAVAGYLESEGVQKGEDGVYVMTRKVTYVTHTVDGVSIHPLASEEVFPEAGEPGVTTTFQFSWYGPGSGGASMFGFGTGAFSRGVEAELEDLVVVEQIRTTWNEASEEIMTTSWQRFDDAIGNGPLHGPEGPSPKARRSYQAQWFDGAGRPVATADYGTNGGMLLSRPDVVPARSDVVLVSSTHYKEDGEANTTVTADGIETRWQNDAAGRRIRLVENFKAGLGADSPDANRTTQYAYAPDGGLSRLTLRNAETGDQVTRWEFGTTLADSKVARSDLLRIKIFPSGAGVVYACGELSSGAQRIQYGYNRQGQIIEMKDPNGTVHAYDYDQMGRPTQDRATALAAGINDTVRRLQTAYDSKRLLRASVTSYNDPVPGQGSLLNEVAFEYDELANLSADRQAHSGPVTPETPSVLYKNETGWSNSARRQYMIYPDGLRLLDYDYGPDGEVDDKLSRVRALKSASEDEDTCRYTYIGSGRCVEIAYPQPSVRLSYRKAALAPAGDAGDAYNGYDRFGRTVDMRWLQGEGDANVLDRIQYGFNRVSNRTWRRNLAALLGGQDQAWIYDGLSQVKSGALGTLNINQTAIGGIPARAENWDYDATGNWRRWRQMEDGDVLLDQTRVHNRDNQITQIDGNSEGILYDPAGNTLLIPPDAAGSWSTPQALVWDAWNRLMTVKQENGTPISQHAYDGLSRRVMKLGAAELRHYYYNDQWKCIEERVAGPAESSSSEGVWSSSSSVESSSSSVGIPSSSSYGWPYSSSLSTGPYSSSYETPASSSSDLEDPPEPSAYYRCNEPSSGDGLINIMGGSSAGNFNPHGTAGSVSGMCLGGRRINEYGSGSGWFSAPSSIDFNPGSYYPLFFSFWFKPETLAGTQVLVSKPDEYQILLEESGSILFQLSVSGGGWTKEVRIYQSFSTGEWYHLQAWIIASQTMGVSINFNLATGSQSLGAGEYANDAGNPFCLGYESIPESSTSSRVTSIESVETMAGFNGVIDEMAFFLQELNEEQRAALYNNGAGLFYNGDSWGPCGTSLRRQPLRPLSFQGDISWLAEASSSTSVAAQYVWGARPGHRDELILRDRDSGGADLDERLWCLMDYYDPTSVVSNEGAVMERYQFSAFGLRSVLTSDFISRTASHYEWDFGFKGQFLDLSVGYYNYGYRYYSPGLGRWLSRDPIGESGGVNIYTYALNRSVNALDYLGLEIEEVPDADCFGPITGKQTKVPLSVKKSGKILNKLGWSLSYAAISAERKSCCTLCPGGGSGILEWETAKTEGKLGVSVSPWGASGQFGGSSASFWIGAKFGFEFKLEGSVSMVKNSCDSSEKTKICLSGSAEPTVDIGGGFSVTTGPFALETSISARLSGAIGIFGCYTCHNGSCDYSGLKWARNFAISFETPWWLGNNRTTVWSYQETGPFDWS
ncbi:hypothetical protein GCM10023213_28340 [Prosthecobacter algae]|uniref:RHS repeat-associated protein n=1 Tax=Prosthecobacter algae TaxID=1144682 RepID=A0ABP9P8J4_9BACT